MNGILFAEINLIPILSMLFLLSNSKVRLTDSLNNRRMRALMRMLVCIMLADSIAWTLNGKSGDGVRLALSCANFCYFVLIGLLPYTWFCYVYERLWEWTPRPAVRAAFTLPLAAYLLALCATPWLHTIFYIDEQNLYHRGSLVLAQQLVCIAYLLATSAMTLAGAHRAKNEEMRREAFTLCLFIVLPVAGAVLQMLSMEAMFCGRSRPRL